MYNVSLLWERWQCSVRLQSVKYPTGCNRVTLRVYFTDRLPPRARRTNPQQGLTLHRLSKLPHVCLCACVREVSISSGGGGRAESGTI